MPGDGDEGAPYLAAFLGADRDVLQIRLGRRQPAGRGGGERVGRVHAVRRRIDVSRQRLGIGRAQLRHLPPVENLARQRVALLGEFFQFARAGRPLPGLGLGAAGQAHFAEQDVAELLGRAGIERLAGERLDFVFQRALLLGEFAGQPREHLAVDGNAAPLHARQHRRHGALQRFVDGGDVLGRQPRFERVPQPQRHVGVLGGVFGRLVDGDAIEGHLRLAGAGDVWKWMVSWSSQRLARSSMPWPPLPASST